jgi:hypothetical protein
MCPHGFVECVPRGFVGGAALGSTGPDTACEPLSDAHTSLPWSTRLKRTSLASTSTFALSRRRRTYPTLVPSGVAIAASADKPNPADSIRSD